MYILGWHEVSSRKGMDWMQLTPLSSKSNNNGGRTKGFRAAKITGDLREYYDNQSTMQDDIDEE
jgi:hypothetical protein